MSKKSAKIASMIADLEGRGLDAHYLGYFECFNQSLFYEAHDVLEELWLGCRGQTDDLFYKGLIQFAGAFVHLQKGRLRPAAALFKLARGNLERYPAIHHRLEVAAILGLIEKWLGWLELSGFTTNPLVSEPPPLLQLLPS